MSGTSPSSTGDDGWVDLASRALGGRVVSANDELFADRRNLITPGPAAWDPSTFGPDGKVYDGWETRRRRGPVGALPGPDEFDHAVVRLAAPGVVSRVVVDTTHFRGNYPASASVEALRVDGYPDLATVEAGPWTSLVPRSPLAGDTENAFDVRPGAAAGPWTHVRLCVYPDGGVARLRVLGEVRPDPRLLEGTVDLLAAQHGGRVVGCSDRFYSQPTNLIRPGVATTIGEGWETARRRVEGNEWVAFALAAAGVPRVLEVDTTHYVGNPPGAARLLGVDARRAGGTGGAGQEAGAGAVDPEDLTGWTELVPRTALLPDTVHRFRVRDALAQVPIVSHVRLDIYPDGGVNRVRLTGEVAPEELEAMRSPR